MIRIAHLSDPHLPPPSPPKIRQLFSKRILGYINWLISRRHIHHWHQLHTLADDIAAHDVDQICLTGDIINLATPHEFEAATRWLETLGDPTRLCVIPGNHDCYTPLPEARGLRLWARYMTMIAGRYRPTSPITELQWPYIRPYKGLRIIGLNSGVPTPPFNATGKLGADQIARAERMLMAAKTGNRCRVILIHHPPLPGLTRPRRRLRDAGAFYAMLRRAGAELILHGHDHTDTLQWAKGPDRPIPIIGVPSASATGANGKPAAQWNLLLFERGEDRWNIRLKARRFDKQDNAMQLIYERDLHAD